MFALLSHPGIVEIIGYAGFDIVVIDTEHAPGSPYGPDLETLIRAADASNVPAWVRVTENQPGMILKALDAGASGVVVPHVRTREEAMRAVAACRYPPLGTRSAAPVVRSAHHGLLSWDTYLERENDEKLVLVMIEDQEAVDHLEDVLSADGIDGVFIGTWDLAVDLGVAGYGAVNEKVLALCEKIFAACQKRDLFIVSHGWDVESVEFWINRGCNVAVFSTDVSVFVNAVRTVKSQLDAITVPSQRARG